MPLSSDALDAAGGVGGGFAAADAGSVGAGAVAVGAVAAAEGRRVTAGREAGAIVGNSNPVAVVAWNRELSSGDLTTDSSTYCM